MKLYLPLKRPIILFTLVMAGLILISPEMKAQDIHFSQFYNSPLTLNPAMTGNFDGTYRLAGNYRRQWASIHPNTPFETFAASVDMEIPNNLIKSGKIAWGLQFFNDQSGLSNLTNQSIFGSLAYHHAINKDHVVSIGFQGGLVNKRIDYSRLTFNNQFDGQIFSSDLPHGESGMNESMSYMDFQAGLGWTSVLNEKLSAFGGIAMFHLTQPNESFLNQTDNPLESRLAVHAGTQYKVNEKVGVVPSVIFMSQRKAQEINLGASATYELQEGKLSQAVLYFGSWFRMSAGNSIIDAAIPTTGLQYKNWKLGLSYDVNISSLNEASTYRGGPEISLIYIGNLSKPLPINPVLPCIRY